MTPSDEPKNGAGAGATESGDDDGMPLGTGRATADTLADRLLHRDLRSRIFGSAPPVEIGGYEISHRIGAGGMGIVLAARDHRLQRDVALKLVLADDPRGHQQMLREARALAKLSHPNVVTVHEVGEHDGRVFVAMELVAGETLRVWLSRPRSAAQIAAVFVQAAEGLAAAHRAGLVHRDFKPDNVIIGGDDTPSARALTGRVRVVDFGLALESGAKTALSTTTTSLADPDSRPHELGGTPRYMALEQFSDRRVDARADVFAFCVSLFEAFHGQRPFSADTVGDLVFALERGPRNLQWRRDVPRAIVRLVEAGLSSDPADRPATLEPFIVALRRIGAPSRRRAIVLGTGIALAGASVGVWSYARSSDTPKLAVSSLASENVCASDPEPDPRSCDALYDTLTSGPEAAHDWDSRCAYRRACEPSRVECPSGTQWDGTLGCALPACEGASDADATARCDAGDISCCARSASAQYTEGLSTESERAAVVEALSRACAGGDALSCTSLATVARELTDDEEGAVAALATACRLGFVQGCHRIAILPEELEGVNPECTMYPDDSCPAITHDVQQLGHFARCRTLTYEFPEPGHDLARDFEAAGVALLPDERTALAAAQAAVEAADAAAYTAMWHELQGQSAPPQNPSLELVVFSALHERYGIVEDTRAIQRLADERAGIVAPEPTQRGTALDRWYNQHASHALRLEREVALRLGDARAAALHGNQEIWPGYGVARYQGRCPA